MSDKDLLVEATDFYKESYQENTPEWATAKAQLSIAASLLVIARNSIPLQVSHVSVDHDIRDPGF